MVNFMLPLRGAQAVFTVVVLGLTAYGKSNWICVTDMRKRN